MSQKESNNITRFKGELTKLINRFGLENKSNTPDFIIADYLVNCLDSFNKAHVTKDCWFGDDLK